MKFYRIHSSENISICHKAKIIICDLNAYTYKYIYNNKDKYKLKIDKELETNTEFKNIALWKMKISKLA